MMVSRLSEAFVAFLLESEGGKSLDSEFDANAKEGKFPDFEILDGKVTIEIKEIKDTKIDRINSEINAFLFTEKIRIFGSISLDRLYATNNGDSLKSRLDGLFKKHAYGVLRQANKQLRRNAYDDERIVLRILVVINDSSPLFDGFYFMREVNNYMSINHNGGTPRFESIDAVLFIDETKLLIGPEGQNMIKVTAFYGKKIDENPHLGSIVDQIVKRWSEFRTDLPMVELQE